MHPLFQFIVDNPGVSFLLSWPLALVLISVSWIIATTTVSFINGALILCRAFGVMFVTLIRGYPPVSWLSDLNKEINGGQDNTKT